MSVRLAVASNCQPTGRIIAELLTERGIDLVTGTTGGDAVICYGVRYTGEKPSLNANAGTRSKLDELSVLARAGITTVPAFIPNQDDIRSGADVVRLSAITGVTTQRYPMLARRENHMHGKDIMPVFQPEELKWRLAAGAAFFTTYIPRHTEYRVWVYRKRILSTYQKVMEYPEKYRYIGCNYRNGFSFKFVPRETAPLDMVNLAANAVNALKLDFGAVDILQSTDGRYYVLEVNTAPGVAGLTREGIKKLADKMVKWVELDYVKRSDRA